MDLKNQLNSVADKYSFEAFQQIIEANTKVGETKEFVPVPLKQQPPKSNKTYSSKDNEMHILQSYQ